MPETPDITALLAQPAGEATDAILRHGAIRRDHGAERYITRQQGHLLYVLARAHYGKLFKSKNFITWVDAILDGDDPKSYISRGLPLEVDGFRIRQIVRSLKVTKRDSAQESP